jgi:hypothetical protein
VTSHDLQNPSGIPAVPMLSAEPHRCGIWRQWNSVRVIWNGYWHKPSSWSIGESPSSRDGYVVGHSRVPLGARAADAAEALALVTYHYCDALKSEVSHLQSETHAPHGALS